MNKSRVALVIGHDRFRKGAYSSTLGQSEFTYNLEVAKLVGCDIYTHSPHLTYKSKMKATYGKLSEYDLILELHFNGASYSANGTEALYFHTNPQGKRIANKFCEIVCADYTTRNRGAKPLSNENQRGYWAVASGIPTTVLLEPFFGSNEESIKFGCKKNYAKTLEKFIRSI